MRLTSAVRDVGSVSHKNSTKVLRLPLMEVRMHCIYKIENKINGKCYIGQTSNFKERLYSHNSKLQNGFDNPLYNAIRKYGASNFSVKVIRKDIKTRHIDACERSCIRKYNSLHPNGYNLTTGGDGVKDPSDETRRKLSESAKKRVYTDETRKKLSDAKIGNTNRSFHWIRDPDCIGAIFALFNSGVSKAEIARIFQVSPQTIARVIKQEWNT